MPEDEITILQGAKTQLSKIMESLNKSHREHLLSFAIQEWMTMKIGVDSDDESNDEDEHVLDDPAAKLRKIVEEIRDKIPLNAILPSENIQLPTKGPNDDCDPKITVHVDGFLYEDDDIEDLVKEGKMSRNYCKDCGSKNTSPLIFISHSASRDELYLIFNTLLPTLDGKILLDVGSRLGAVLYGAYVYSDAEKIIGVEMNKDLCDLQNEVIRKHKMDKRIEIINKRIEDTGDLVRVADVVVLNNVFEFYLSEEEQTSVWKFLRDNIKKGAFIVSRPSISSSLSSLNTGIDVDQWIKPVDSEIDQPVNYFAEETERVDDSMKIFCYNVL
ncbi:uncharacterized protein [Fopius arisanus]|uniref:Methyltransferase type 11 domain-containing protein n=1 Tax=Fopius arisanus TaxID=64838 RepID=A0A9R1TLB0_9HYME|nr:PREDICTED: uncharacterized protein LOC105271226 [Fopius arisanus]